MAPFPRNVFGSAYRRRRLLPKHQWQAIESVRLSQRFFDGRTNEGDWSLSRARNKSALGAEPLQVGNQRFSAPLRISLGASPITPKSVDLEPARARPNPSAARPRRSNSRTAAALLGMRF